MNSFGQLRDKLPSINACFEAIASAGAWCYASGIMNVLRQIELIAAGDPAAATSSLYPTLRCLCRSEEISKRVRAAVYVIGVIGGGCFLVCMFDFFTALVVSEQGQAVSFWDVFIHSRENDLIALAGVALCSNLGVMLLSWNYQREYEDVVHELGRHEQCLRIYREIRRDLSNNPSDGRLRFFNYH